MKIIKILFILLFFSCNDKDSNEYDYLNLNFEQFDDNGQLLSWFIPKRYNIVIDSIDQSDGKYSIILKPMQHISTDHIYLDSTREVSIDVEFDFKVKLSENISNVFYFEITWHNFEKGWISTVDTIKLKKSNNWVTYKQNIISKKGFVACKMSFGYSKSTVALDNVKILIDGDKYQPMILNDRNRQILRDAAVVFDFKNDLIPEIALAEISSNFSSASIVSLGECTHGTKEIFLAKKEIIKYLVENKNFKTIVFESNMGNLELANEFLNMDYISGVDSALSKLFGIYQTKEVRSIFDWIKKYNSSKSIDERVQIAGCDVQSDKAPFQYLQSFSITSNRKILKLLGDYRNEYKVPELLLIVKSIEDEIEMVKEKLSKKNYRKLKHNADLLRQFVKFDSGMQTRDYLMAENIKYIVNHENKVIFWAHNSHIQKYGEKTGAFLKDQNQYVLGFVVNEGTYRAYPKKSREYYLEDNILNRVNCNSYEYFLSMLNDESFFINLEDVNDIETLKHKNLMTNIGHTVPNSRFSNIDLFRAFDGIIYFDKTTSAEGVNQVY